MGEREYQAVIPIINMNMIKTNYSPVIFNGIDFALMIILLCAFLLRVTGITFPVHHFDENVSMTCLLNMLQDNSLNSHSFIYPQQPWFYLNFIVYKVYTFFALLAKGTVTFSTALYFDHIKVNLHEYYVLSRFISGLFSTLSVYLVYIVVRSLTKNSYASIIAAAALAFAPLPNYFTKYFVRVEEMAIPFVLMLTIFLLKYIDSKEIKNLYYCAVLAAFVIAIKWPFALTLAPVFVVLAMEKSFKQFDKKYYKISMIFLCALTTLFMISGIIYSLNMRPKIEPWANRIIFSKLLPQHQKYIIVENDKAVLIQKSLGLLLNLVKKLLILFSVLFGAITVFFAANKRIALKILGCVFDRTAIGLIIVTVISFIIFAPFVLLNPFLVLYEGSAQFWGDYDFLSSLLWYLSNPLAYGIGRILSVLSLFGLIALASNRDLILSKRVVLTLFPVSFLLYLSLPGLRWDRWMLPIIPFQAIYVAYLFDFVQFKYNGKGKSLLKFFLSALIVLGLIAALWRSVDNDRKFIKLKKGSDTKVWILRD